MYISKTQFILNTADWPSFNDYLKPLRTSPEIIHLYWTIIQTNFDIQRKTRCGLKSNCEIAKMEKRKKTIYQFIAVNVSFSFLPQSLQKLGSEICLFMIA